MNLTPNKLLQPTAAAPSALTRSWYLNIIIPSEGPVASGCGW